MDWKVEWLLHCSFRAKKFHYHNFYFYYRAVFNWLFKVIFVYFCFCSLTNQSKHAVSFNQSTARWNQPWNSFRVFPALATRGPFLFVDLIGSGSSIHPFICDWPDVITFEKFSDGSKKEPALLPNLPLRFRGKKSKQAFFTSLISRDFFFAGQRRLSARKDT